MCERERGREGECEREGGERGERGGEKESRHKCISHISNKIRKHDPNSENLIILEIYASALNVYHTTLRTIAKSVELSAY